jgi:hypothetical protein
MSETETEDASHLFQEHMPQVMPLRHLRDGGLSSTRSLFSMTRGPWGLRRLGVALCGDISYEIARYNTTRKYLQ